MSASSDIDAIPGSVRIISSDSGYGRIEPHRSNSRRQIGMGLNGKKERMNRHLDEVIAAKGEERSITIHPKKKVEPTRSLSQSEASVRAREAGYREKEKSRNGGPGSSITSIGKRFLSSRAQEEHSSPRSDTMEDDGEPPLMVLTREVTPGGKVRTVARIDLGSDHVTSSVVGMEIPSFHNHRSKTNRVRKSPPPNWLLPRLNTPTVPPQSSARKRARTTRTIQSSSSCIGSPFQLQQPAYDLVSGMEYGELFSRNGGGTERCQERNLQRRPSTESIFGEQMTRIGLSDQFAKRESSPRPHWTQQSSTQHYYDSQPFVSGLEQSHRFEEYEMEDSNLYHSTGDHSPFDSPMFDNRPKLLGPVAHPDRRAFSPSQAVSLEEMSMSNLSGFWKRDGVEPLSIHSGTNRKLTTPVFDSNPIFPNQLQSSRLPQYDLDPLPPSMNHFSNLEQSDNRLYNPPSEPDFIPEIFEEVSSLSGEELILQTSAFDIDQWDSSHFGAIQAESTQNLNQFSKPNPLLFTPQADALPTNDQQQRNYKTPSPIPQLSNQNNQIDELELDSEIFTYSALGQENNIDPSDLEFTFSQVPLSQKVSSDPDLFVANSDSVDSISQVGVEDLPHSESESGTADTVQSDKSLSDKSEILEIGADLPEMERGSMVEEIEEAEENEATSNRVEEDHSEQNDRSPGQRRRNGKNARVKRSIEALKVAVVEEVVGENEFDIFEDPIEIYIEI